MILRSTVDGEAWGCGRADGNGNGQGRGRPGDGAGCMQFIYDYVASSGDTDISNENYYRDWEHGDGRGFGA